MKKIRTHYTAITITLLLLAFASIILDNMMSALILSLLTLIISCREAWLFKKETNQFIKDLKDEQ